MSTYGNKCRENDYFERLSWDFGLDDAFDNEREIEWLLHVV